MTTPRLIVYDYKAALSASATCLVLGKEIVTISNKHLRRYHSLQFSDGGES